MAGRSAMILLAVGLVICTVVQYHHHSHGEELCLCLRPDSHCHECDSERQEGGGDNRQPTAHHNHGDSEDCCAHISSGIANDDGNEIAKAAADFAATPYIHVDIQPACIQLPGASQSGRNGPPPCMSRHGLLPTRRGPPCA